MTQTTNRLIFICLNSDLLRRIDFDFSVSGSDYIVLRKNLHIYESGFTSQTEGVKYLNYPLKEYISEILTDICEIDFSEVKILCRDVNTDISYFQEIIRFAFAKNPQCSVVFQDVENREKSISATGIDFNKKSILKNIEAWLYKIVFSIFFIWQYLFLLLLIPFERIQKTLKKSYMVCIAKRVHSNQSYVVGKALKEQGVKVLSVDLVSHAFGYSKCDVSQNISKLNPVFRFLKLDFYFLKVFFACDVFLFENNGESFFVTPLWGGDWFLPLWFQKAELILFKLCGKKIIFEMRDCSVYDRKDKLNSNVRNICKECDLNRVKGICSNKRYIEVNKTALKYADFIFCSTPELKAYLPKETMWLPNGFILDSEVKQKDIYASAKIKIIHASSSRGMKGTEEAIAAVERLQKKYDIDFVLIEKMLHQETIAHIDSADIVLGQLSCGAYGNFEIEAMAHAKPIICYIQDKFYVDVEVPFVNVEGDDIVSSVVSRCEELILNEKLRKDYAKRSYVYVKEMHDYQKTGATVKNVIEKLQGIGK